MEATAATQELSTRNQRKAGFNGAPLVCLAICYPADVDAEPRHRESSRTTPARHSRSSGLFDRAQLDDGVEPAVCTCSTIRSGLFPSPIIPSTSRDKTCWLKASFASRACFGGQNGISRSRNIRRWKNRWLGKPLLALLAPKVCLAFGKETPGRPDQAAGAAIPRLRWRFHRTRGFQRFKP